ncbi:hypothetical protein CK203_037470 [Vitis vinifera]|uniref:Uncharacterized protein n=1 Tax=Vitis vinifera TaxID=29760 RepID=A0A438HDS7_VITVI|nr:hypothetical protein CK203_037470 [Vitis vinifera]
MAATTRMVFLLLLVFFTSSMLKAEANPHLPYVIKASSSTTGIVTGCEGICRCGPCCLCVHDPMPSCKECCESCDPKLKP